MTLTLWKDLSVRREVRKHLMSGDEEAKKAAAVKASSLEAKGGGHLKPAALKNFYNHAWLPKRKVFWCRLVPPTSPFSLLATLKDDRATTVSFSAFNQPSKAKSKPLLSSTIPDWR